MIDEPTEIQIDLAFIEVFGEPMRDEEQLSWDNLKFCKETKQIVSIESEWNTSTQESQS